LWILAVVVADDEYICNKSSRQVLQIALIAIGTAKIRGSGTGSWYVAKGIAEFFSRAVGWT